MSEAAPIGRAAPFGRFERTLSWRYLRAKRENGGAALVSIISFVGIALAVTALVVVMSIMNGFRGELIDKLLSGRGHVFVDARFTAEADSDRVAEVLRELKGVTSVTPIIEGQAFATSRDDSRGIFIRGLPGDAARDLEFIKERMVEGSAETFGEGDKGGNEIMIAAEVANILQVRVGDNIQLVSSATTQTAMGSLPKRKTYTVSAIFRTGYGELDQIFTLMPIEQAQLFFNYQGRYQNLELRMVDPRHSDRLTAQIRERFPNANVTDWKEVNQSIVNALAVEAMMMRIIFLVLVTITSLNIITGVVMLVKNKTRDVAILRTIGASQGSVLRVFLMVGAFLGIAGTLVGLFLGLLMVWNIGAIQDFLDFVSGRSVFAPEVYGLDRLPAEINWLEIGGAVIWAIVMSILVTLAPAWRAARLDPVDALRFE